MLREGPESLDIHIHPDLHEESYSLLSQLNSPTFILHGSGDLDIPVSNAFYLEQKLRQNIEHVTRSVLLDCDHWFRSMPYDTMNRLTERLDGSCIHNSIDNRLYQCLSRFIWGHLQSEKERLLLTEGSDDKFIRAPSFSFSL